MKPLIKIYGIDDYSTSIAQIFGANNIQIREVLSGSDSMFFDLPINHPQISSIKEFRRIELYFLENGLESLYWRGFILNPTWDFYNMTIECPDEKRYLDKKILYSEKDYTSSPITVENFLNEITNEANLRAGNTFLSYETNISGNISKKFEKGKSYFSILEELAELFNAEFNCINGKINLKTNIGLDRTSGVNFFEFVNSKNNPANSNISNVKYSKNGDSIVTALIGKGGSNYQEEETSFFNYGRTEKQVYFSEGDLVEQTQKELEKLSVSQIEIEVVTANSSSSELKNLNIGDLVPVRIDRGDPFVDLNENFKIIQKETNFNDLAISYNIILSTITKKTNNDQNFIFQIKSDVEKLKLK